jgi:hypothetical protein
MAQRTSVPEHLAPFGEKGVTKKEGPTESSLTLPTRRKNLCPSLNHQTARGGRCLMPAQYCRGLLRLDKESERKPIRCNPIKNKRATSAWF